ncbi:MAG: aminomethyl-transferring glycine dehydrogenase subunit GcvPB [Thermoanaerobaculia bacterium]
MKINYKKMEKTIFELSGEGKKGINLPSPEFEKMAIPEDLLRKEIEDFPSLSQTEVVRHFTRLSSLNHSIDHGFYPLGSCTMKHNPKLNETLASLKGFTSVHPNLPENLVQGCLELIYLLEDALKKLTEMDRVTLLPAAGAHGELTGMMMIRKAHQVKGNPRKIVLIPDSAHGTNPASSVFAGYQTKEIKSNEKGMIDLSLLEKEVNEDVAALMLTNPNTLGIFETNIKEISEILHKKGAYLYLDGANFNAFVGQFSPKRMGVDVMHLNLHKTFSTPHGGGGPGSGPVAVVKEFEGFLPVPVVEKNESGYYLNYDLPNSIGKIRSFYGQFSVLVRAYSYILQLGIEGFKEVSNISVLLANYIRRSLEGTYRLKYDAPTMHEVVFDDSFQEKKGVKNIDIAKRLLDFGVHPPTVSFPLIVHGALMIEPTETEPKEEIDHFIFAMKKIAEEIEQDPEFVKGAPYTTPVLRLDEVKAARQPKLRWKK